mmetsp:Transcript_11619/g.17874  ORF Transcript_11619/g.17874 Transcript_11619/m.17874 type:complete len:104 (-) Transcript_11619:89-400(-)
MKLAFTMPSWTWKDVSLVCVHFQTIQIQVHNHLQNNSVHDRKHPLLQVIYVTPVRYLDDIMYLQIIEEYETCVYNAFLDLEGRIFGLCSLSNHSNTSSQSSSK